MSAQAKARFLRLLDNVIEIIGTHEIIPAMLFKRLGRLSLYVEHYYIVHARKIILIIEPMFQPASRDITPLWSSTLINCILQRLTSAGLVMDDHYTFVNAFMARYRESTEFLQELAFAWEDRHSPMNCMGFLFVWCQMWHWMTGIEEICAINALSS